ncbi:hypothetical protein [Persicitalea jodogahamensis]|uniref:Uncharacterized protein n=1 Tax=Persicitalea jodogahamensis TaxID=402147 RepID=A0A8J3D580_9BACT|nr:hypothetical protein [Persicitalea jodogahamensis]GHB75776.1 hypothetical protein GCM10007390_32010 [Persicitalea jodogahamensis]
MKKTTKKVGWALLGMMALAACNKETEVDPTDAREYKYVRVMVSDEVTNEISIVDPRNGKVETFQAKFPMGALYTTESGRFGVVVHRDNNLVQNFDTGFENHGDHVDVKGTPKWAAMVGEGKLPTHFKTKADEVILFNDGDGTLSVGKESDFHVAGMKLKTIETGLKAHHGAMAKFSNETYAITEKDGSVAGTLPERVRIMDANGKQVHASTIQTKGIHGNASDGNVAVFGSASGILIVEASGKQRLIAHPADFGTAWFGTIMEAGQPGKFVGYTAAKGAYLIDLATDKVTPIVQTDDIMQAKVDYANNRLVILMHSGEVKIYDLKANTLNTSGNILPATARDEKQKPQLAATSKYLYVTQPKTGELLTVETDNLTNTSRIKVSGTPFRLSIMGMESSEDH